MKKFYKPLIVACGILGAGTMYAQDSTNVAEETETTTEEVTDIYDMDLEALMNMDMEVTVASKKAEKTSDAPANITVYSDKDMERMGYYTLRDLANITSGYSSFRGIGENTLETRGQKADGFDNNKHLVLIDGIPFSHTRANMAMTEENLPLYFAKRVEFMKGPGSALYGISAFSGVVNVVSKDLEENGTLVESKLSVGNYDFKRRMMANVVHKADAGVTKFAFGLYAKDATNDPLGNGNLTNLNAVNRDNVSSIFANVSHNMTEGALDGAGIGMIYSRKQGGLGDFWMNQQNQTYPINDLTWETMVPYLKYKRSLTDKLGVNSYLKGNISSEKANVGGYQTTTANGNSSIGTAYNVTVFDFEFLGELSYDFNENMGLIGGFNYDSRYDPGYPYSYGYGYNQNPGLTNPQQTTFMGRSSSYRTYSVYAQYQHKVNSILSGMIVTAGARLDMGRVTDKEENKVTNKYDQFSPRIAVVQKLTDKLNAKVIYGAALRAPLIKEVGLNEEAENLNNISLPDLKAETIQSLDLSLTWSDKKVNASGTYFINSTENTLIKESHPQVPDGQVQANAPGTTRASGFEFDANYIPVKNIRVGANYAYAKAILDGDTMTTANVPTSKLNANATYYVFAPFKLSTTLVWHMVADYRKGTGHMDNNDQLLDGFNVLDLNIVASVTKNVNLELQVRNLLDSDYRTPAFFASGEHQIKGAGRSFLGSVNVRF